MSLVFNKFPLFAPNDSAVADKSPLTLDSIQDYLKDETTDEAIDLDEKEPEEKPEKESKTKTEEKEKEKEKEEEEDELSQFEDEKEEPAEDDLELTTPARRKDILKKYPELFKDFPYLEKAYYREQQFTELLPTIDDAKVAVEKASTLDALENDLVQGNLGKLFLASKNDNSQSFHKLVDNLLPSLAQVDEGAYHHIIGNIIKSTIVGMVREGRKANNEALESAAVVLNQYVFGSSEFTPASKLTKEERNTDEQDRLTSERQQFAQERFNSVNESLNTRVENIIHNTIVNNIDPKESMTDYVRKNAIRETEEMIADLIEQDSRFRKIRDNLWIQAARSGYSKQAVDRIQSACVVKVKSLLPSVLKKARNEALRGMGKRVRDDDSEQEIVSSSNGKRRSAPPQSQTSRGPKPGQKTID